MATIFVGILMMQQKASINPFNMIWWLMDLCGDAVTLSNSCGDCFFLAYCFSENRVRCSLSGQKICFPSLTITWLISKIQSKEKIVLSVFGNRKGEGREEKGKGSRSLIPYHFEAVGGNPPSTGDGTKLGRQIEKIQKWEGWRARLV